VIEKVSIVLLRHGRSRADDEEVHEGRYDSPLTDVGRAQVRARALGWRDKGERFDLIICSPLVRARETAELVAETLGAPLEADDDWMEVDHGPLAGVPLSELAARFPGLPSRNPYEPVYGTGESAWQTHRRASAALERILRRGPGAYLIVGHGGILNAALRCVVGAQPPVNDLGVWFEFGDTGYARAAFYPETSCWVIERLGS
jgi:2,3-bisphosphoglycerate-dependent phosphoglycerate mutase